MRNLLAICIVSICSIASVNGQEYLEESNHSPLTQKECTKYSKRVIRKSNALANRIKKVSEKSLHKFHELEADLLQAYCNVNEDYAESLLRTSVYSFRRYEDLLDRKKHDNLNIHNSELDSISVYATYLKNHSNCSCTTLDELNASQNRLKDEMKRAELTNTYLKERKHYLSTLPLGSAADKRLPKIEQLSYYNQEYLTEYTNLFSQRNALEKAITSKMASMPSFQHFLQNNAGSAQPMLITHYHTAGANTPTNQELQEKLFSSITNKNKLGSALKDTQSDLNELSRNTSKIYISNTEYKTRLDSAKKTDPSARPQWKPNPLKTKRFIDRLNYGFQLQTDARTNIFPTTFGCLGNISYKITTRMNLGMGASYLIAHQKISSGEKLNLGKFNSEGYAFRTFYNYALFSALFAQVNYEWNLRTATESTALQTINDPLFNTRLQVAPAILAGLKLKSNPTGKRSKTIECLYDFRHKLTGQPPLVVRVGVEISNKKSHIN